MRVERALVVGAGPAGLSAAIALLQAGAWTVDIVELTDGDGVIGSELLLAGPVLRALDALGVADGCAATGVGLERGVHQAMDGRVLAETPFPPAHRGGLPPAVGISRPALHQILGQRAVELGGSLRHGVSVTSFENQDDAVAAELTDGTVATYDLLVGADGVASRTRTTALPGAEEPTYVGQAAWRARVARGDLAPELVVAYGPHAKPGVIPVSADYAYLFCLVTIPRFERLPRERFPTLLRAALEGFGGPVGEASQRIGDAEHIHYSPLMPVIVSSPWYDGRCVVIGDAVHATTPHLAFGAGLAIEDGVVLAEEIATHDTLGDGLASFFARRYERCRMVVDNGIQLSRWEQSPDDTEGDSVGLIGESFMALARPA